MPPLHHLVSLLQQRADEILHRQIGIGLGQVRILAVLHSTTAHSQRAIAKKLRQTEANVSRQVRHMRGRGLVSIRRNNKDARQRDVTLTVHGERELQAAQQLLHDHQKELLQTLGAKGRSFKSAAESLLRTLG